MHQKDRYKVPNHTTDSILVAVHIMNLFSTVPFCSCSWCPLRLLFCLGKHSPIFSLRALLSSLARAAIILKRFLRITVRLKLTLESFESMWVNGSRTQFVQSPRSCHKYELPQLPSSKSEHGKFEHSNRNEKEQKNKTHFLFGLLFKLSLHSAIGIELLYLMTVFLLESNHYSPWLSCCC
jgi:hypothetical protein